jgi:uncharacterized protein YndB with AHSA1/START domain
VKEKLTFKAFYPHSPERVWKALTDPQALAQWLLPNNFKPQIGLRFRFSGGERLAQRAIECELLALEEGKSVSYTWDDGEAGSPSVVRWTLSPKDGGTELHLEHEAALEAPSYVLIEAAPNWRFSLHSSLPGVLARYYPPVPIVYAAEDEKPCVLPRAGFRQEEPVCV